MSSQKGASINTLASVVIIAGSGKVLSGIFSADDLQVRSTPDKRRFRCSAKDARHVPKAGVQPRFAPYSECKLATMHRSVNASRDLKMSAIVASVHNGRQ